MFVDKASKNTTFKMVLWKSISFDLEVKNHIEWKNRLEKYVINPNGSLVVSDVCADNKCNLGIWIYSQEGRFKDLFEWHDLKEKHANFHKIAGNIVKNANAGTRNFDYFQGESEYIKSSIETISAISRLEMIIDLT